MGIRLEVRLILRYYCEYYAHVFSYVHPHPVAHLNHLPRRERLLDSWENPGQKDYAEARGPGSDITYNVL